MQKPWQINGNVKKILPRPNRKRDRSKKDEGIVQAFVDQYIERKNNMKIKLLLISLLLCHSVYATELNISISGDKKTSNWNITYLKATNNITTKLNGFTSDKNFYYTVEIESRLQKNENLSSKGLLVCEKSLSGYNNYFGYGYEYIISRDTIDFGVDCFVLLKGEIIDLMIKSKYSYEWYSLDTSYQFYNQLLKYSAGIEYNSFKASYNFNSMPGREELIYYDIGVKLKI